eukprot:2684403-Prymnesium_polylepis.1
MCTQATPTCCACATKPSVAASASTPTALVRQPRLAAATATADGLLHREARPALTRFGALLSSARCR